ncbi:uncharacterized protein LOC129299457 [Prosopis cineraria]|uniref:uncharacterized protein LOC129299457 n=1 Tax=Prosopis cineraria TaxID=364024 RepID=UPI00240FC655|nr:uncharacterized protein LOC129299457 [Prosopis cineraria]
MQVSRWRNVFSLRTYLIPSPKLAPSRTLAFHSTPFSCQKWKNKSNSNHIRFVVREKRSDAKKALKDLLYNSGASKFSSQRETTWKLEGDHDWCEDQENSDDQNNKGQPKSRRKFGKSKRKTKGKIRRGSFCEDFDDPETIFCARFGYKSSTWSFCDWRGSSFENSTSGFDHRSWANRSRTRKWNGASDAESSSDVESDDDINSCFVGLLSDRTILGLPPTGPLKIEDVKNAFRLSALKWHPDKHQGPSQVMAEEKFKQCVNAYKSLCSAISSA